MPRLSKEQKEKIRELQEKGISDAEISKMLGISYFTVYCQRPEVKERKREYMREYYQRPEVKERIKKRMREYWKKYYQRPEVKERKREYYQKRKLEKKGGGGLEGIALSEI